MTDPRALGYGLLVDGDTIPISGSITVGRHLDNDLVIAGEDVLDFHLRIDLSTRGPIAVPLGDAVLYLNERLLELPAGLMPGDRIEVGQSLLQLDAQSLEVPEAETWRLCVAGDPEGLPVREVLLVGREPGSDLHLTDYHVSRRHAQLYNVQGSVWVRDLGSANGTFINGERIRGARRLFHGDEVRFDHCSCQLLGRGADLTPARAPNPRDRQPLLSKPSIESRPEDGDTLEFAVVPRPVRASPTRWGGPVAEGLYLVSPDGLPGAGWYRLQMGRTIIGRRTDCDLLLRDRTVSALHAELELRPEGTTLTDLMSTNGTLCNERRVQSVRLNDGDRLQVGRVDLLYREIEPDPARKGARRWLPAAVLLLTVGTAVLLLL